MIRFQTRGVVSSKVDRVTGCTAFRSTEELNVCPKHSKREMCQIAIGRMLGAKHCLSGIVQIVRSRGTIITHFRNGWDEYVPQSRGCSWPVWSPFFVHNNKEGEQEHRHGVLETDDK